MYAAFSETGINEYTIGNAGGWDVFCDALLDNDTYNRFSGKTVKLGADISVTRMAGSQSHDFCGTFDGQGYTLTFNYGSAETPATADYVAPFSYVSNTKANSGDANNSPAAISNLRVCGDIYTSGQQAAGTIARKWGSVSITNCRSSINIHSSHEGDGSHGGLVAVNNSDALTIEGCLFDGRLLGETTNKCGGFIGWRDGSVEIRNSLFAPTEVTVLNTESATFARNDVDTYNCYYTNYLCDGSNYVPGYNEQKAVWRNGKAPRTVTAGDTKVSIGGIELTGDATAYNVSGITAYSNGGLKRTINDETTLYYGSGDQMSLTIGHSEGYNLGGYTASAGTLSGSENPYTLTMPDEDVTITATLTVIPWDGTGDKNDPYIIEYPSQLELAQRVNSATGDSYATSGYSGKYFVLSNDITYSTEGVGATESNYTAIGGYFDFTNRYFMGTFNGQGHTISGIRIYKGDNSNSDCYQGLFGQAGSSAVIRRVTLADAQITGLDDIGGIVGYSKGTVSDCHVAADVAIHAVNFYADSHGGIVGVNFRGGTVSNCTSAVTLTKTRDGVSYYGSIVGDNGGTLSNTLAIGAVVPAAKDNTHGAIVGYNNNGTLENNYYHACKVASNDITATGVGCGYISDGNGGRTTADITDDDGAVPTLRDDADNSTALSLLAALATAGFNGTPLDLGWDAGKYPVQLSGRTLTKDGNWNTLCLPFAVSDFRCSDDSSCW